VRELTPSEKGAAAEAAITARAIELGLVVLRPLCEGGRYDLVIDLEPELMRVQCKWATQRADVLSVNLTTSRLTPNGYVRTTYTAAEVDAIGVYSADLRSCFLIPIAEVAEGRAIHLRLKPAKNNQIRRVRWADDYDLDAVIARWRERQGARPDQPDKLASARHSGL
jgi:hypothetical protein